jgi:hypothetical protein
MEFAVVASGDNWEPAEWPQWYRGRVNGDLEGSEASPRPRISLCCITGGPLHQVAAILRLYRPVVDEIVVAVNGRFTQEELEPLVGLADRVLPCEMQADFLQERYRAWLYAECRGEFICTVDTDEVPSAALLAALRELASARDVVTYLTACRWCFPDVEHWLDEYPWEPSWKMILVRNDPATLHIKGGVHEGVMAVSPYRFMELPIYHLSDATLALEQREAKVAFYDTLDGNQLLEDGRPVSQVFYLPEHFALFEPGSIPPEDVALINEVLAADISNDRVLERESVTAEPFDLLPDTVAYETILASWPERPLSPSAYNVEIELRRGRTPERDISRLGSGEVRQMMVLVRNRGDATLLRESRNRVALSARFFSVDSDANRQRVVREGARFAFPADLHPGQDTLMPFEVRAPELPGDYLLVVDLVEENLRWFESGLVLAVHVDPESSGALSSDDSTSRTSATPVSRLHRETELAIDEDHGNRTAPMAAPTSIRIQSVFYSPEPHALTRYLRALGQMVRTLTRSRPDVKVEVAFADNSPSALYSPEGVEQLRSSFDDTGLAALSYEHFSENPGHGGAHNRLYREAGDADLILVLNPDTCPSPNLLLELLAAMTDSVGIVEARQLPLEHQKAYDTVTGDTSWASGACSLVRREVFEATGGYDDESFFLYCDDVDLSWRARLAGYRVIYQPSATCFHDKRLSAEAREQPSDTEVFHSGLAGLLLATKYSRPDLVESQLHHFANSPRPIHARIVEEFTRRRGEGRLPTSLDPDGRVADFSTYAYAPLRFDYDR